MHVEPEEHDRVAVVLASTYEFVSRNRTYIIGAVAALIVLVVAVSLILRAQAAERREIRSQMAEAVLLLQGMEYGRASLQLESLLERHSGGAIGRELRTLAATAAFMSGNHDRARDLYERIPKTAPAGSYEAQTAREGLAAVHETRGEFVQAAEIYEALAPEAFSEENEPLLLAHAARCYEMAGRVADVRRIGEMLQAEFAETNEYWRREGQRLVARARTLEMHPHMLEETTQPPPVPPVEGLFDEG